MSLKSKKPEISIILPCRNEEKSLDYVLREIKSVIKENNLNAEIIVSDSSSDSCFEIAKKHKVRIVKHNKNGYGNAYLEAYPKAKGDLIFMADSDGTYEFKEIPKFISYLKKGNDFVIGDRFSGKMHKKSMPLLHKYIGNPVLSGLVRMFYGKKVKDVHCGMRAIKKEKLKDLKLKTTGMEFASEMVIKAMQNNLKIKEVPIEYKERIGKSKLRSFRDGWRHLRFILLYSPLLLFFIPGTILFLTGVLTLTLFYFGNPLILGKEFIYHPMFISSALTVIGYQIIIFAGFAKIYAMTHFDEKNKFLEKIFRYITLEKAITVGTILTILGILIYIFILHQWISIGFGELNQIKNSIIALTLIIVGIQTIFSSFMLSILGIKER